MVSSMTLRKRFDLNFDTSRRTLPSGLPGHSWTVFDFWGLHAAWLETMTKGIVLYRSILKAHKNRLPAELRKLGNDYVRNEFQAHKQAKEEHLLPFFKEWEGYLETLERRSGTFGSDMDRAAVSALNEEQRQKLSQLKDEVEKR